jgi:hypothetical protein
MPIFDSGVSMYYRGKATVEATFPVDLHGRADVSCFQCKFFRRTAQLCGLNGEICEYPQKYIGSQCPLNFDSESEENNNAEN